MANRRTPARLLDFPGRVLRAVLVAVPGDPHVKARVRERDGRGPADAAVAAGNDRDRHVTLAPRTGRRPNCGPTATSHPRGWPASQGVGSAARADRERGGI